MNPWGKLQGVPQHSSPNYKSQPSMAAQIDTDNLQYKSLITAFLYFIPIITLKSRIISTISIARVNLQSISNRFCQTGYQNCEC